MRTNLPLLFAVLAIAWAPLSFAGSLFQCPKAVTSVHSGAMAIADESIEWPKSETGEPVIGKLLKIKFTVMSKATFIDKSQKLSAPLSYWGDWPWVVELAVSNPSDRSFLFFCVVPLVTDDARFLVLLATGPAFSGALRIYARGEDRNRMHDGTVKGVLIRTITLKELWPESKFRALTSWDDHTPQWFADGSFDFSPDNLQLVHATRWGNIDYINLRDGTVENVPSIVPALPH